MPENDSTSLDTPQAPIVDPAAPEGPQKKKYNKLGRPSEYRPCIIKKMYLILIPTVLVLFA